ncbi:hypothetical protein EW146_g1595 [Bondarzewia mesenterica]|uniref:J domain-containing protein n=1 Tax=Bondarzewia mesenterica TaxID=1095465 RepID=A0A4S4M567_9AGAM|nr:hypothetical protein EW146_g1595 [Bondarzewia mesenterica]
MSLPENGVSSPRQTPFHEKDFLYSVLNLPRTASDNEIRERYRTLSVVFHPDKQRDDTTKATANKRFLEIQKAYEVLSDPFSRQVYDILGYESLNLTWPPELRSKPRDEVRLCDRPNVLLPLRAREIDEKTKVFITSRIAQGKPGSDSLELGGGNVLGTIRHQYSPRLDFEVGVIDYGGATASLLRSHFVNVKGVYHSDDGTFIAQTTLSPRLRPVFPPLTLSYSRRLFRKSFTEGVLVLHTGSQPYLAINVVSPIPFNLTYHPENQEKSSSSTNPGSVSGLGVGLRHWSYGVTLAGMGTCLRTECGVIFSELKMEAKLVMQLGLAGFSWVFSGAWGNEQGGVTTTVGLSAAGVELKLDLTYLGQQLSVPITVADDYDASLGLITAVVPTTAFVLAYQLILKPRRRDNEQRKFYRAARREFVEERSSVRREVEETISLLKDAARKHMQVEKATEGLVILEAIYGPMDSDPEARDLEVDVTVPIQALVHKGQLNIPGHRPKSGLQGFYDPAPTCAKALKIRYTFLGRMHYAEIPDYVPVVLPLEVFSLSAQPVQTTSSTLCKPIVLPLDHSPLSTAALLRFVPGNSSHLLVTCGDLS